MTGFSSSRVGLFASILHGRSFTVDFRLDVDEERESNRDSDLLVDVRVSESTLPGRKLIPEGDDKAWSLRTSLFCRAKLFRGRFKLCLFSTLEHLVLFSLQSRVAKRNSNRTKRLGPPDEARVAQAEADLGEVFAYYNRLLARQNYLTRDELTLVDMFHLPNGSVLKAFGYKGTFEKYPNVDKWFTG